MFDGSVCVSQASLEAQTVKSLPAMQETQVWSLGWKDPWRRILYVICAWQKPAAAKSLQLRLTLCDPIDGSPLGSPVPGILQARTLEWVAIFFSNAWKWKVKAKSLSRVRPLATPWTAAHQAPQSIGFSIVLRKQHFLLKTSLSPNKMAIGLRLLVWFSNLGF